MQAEIELIKPIESESELRHVMPDGREFVARSAEEAIALCPVLGKMPVEQAVLLLQLGSSAPKAPETVKEVQEAKPMPQQKREDVQKVQYSKPYAQNQPAIPTAETFIAPQISSKIEELTAEPFIELPTGYKSEITEIAKNEFVKHIELSETLVTELHKPTITADAVEQQTVETQSEISEVIEPIIPTPSEKPVEANSAEPARLDDEILIIEEHEPAYNPVHISEELTTAVAAYSLEEFILPNETEIIESKELPAVKELELPEPRIIEAEIPLQTTEELTVNLYELFTESVQNIFDESEEVSPVFEAIEIDAGVPDLFFAEDSEPVVNLFVDTTETSEIIIPSQEVILEKLIQAKENLEQYVADNSEILPAVIELPEQVVTDIIFVLRALGNEEPEKALITFAKAFSLPELLCAIEAELPQLSSLIDYQQHLLKALQFAYTQSTPLRHDSLANLLLKLVGARPIAIARRAA